MKFHLPLVEKPPKENNNVYAPYLNIINFDNYFAYGSFAALIHVFDNIL